VVAKQLSSSVDADLIYFMEIKKDTLDGFSYIKLFDIEDQTKETFKLRVLDLHFGCDSLNSCSKDQFESFISKRVSPKSFQATISKMASFRMQAINDYTFDPKCLDNSFLIQIQDKVLTTIETFILAPADP